MRLLFATAVCCLAVMGGPAPAATFRVNAGADSHDSSPGDGIAGDHLDADSSHCTLRSAVEEANALDGPDTILVPVAYGPIRLTLGSLYVNDNGTLISGENGRPPVDAVGNPTNHATFIIESDSNTVRSLSLSRSRGDGFLVFGSGNLIGGPSPGDGLILTANGIDNASSYAVRISGSIAVGNIVAGNYIGLSADGITADGNVNGISIEYDARLNWIGGLATGARNIISGNHGYGIVISGNAYENRIAGNFIGPDRTGRSGPGNQFDGIAVLTGAERNFIGADSLPQGNVISANWGHGITISGSNVTLNRIDGNLIGTDHSGYSELGNLGDGVFITEGSHDNRVGGTLVESGNLISGNGGHGLHLSGQGVAGNTLTANWIGITRDGYGYLGNGWLIGGDGIAIENGANQNTVGGPIATHRNIISANQRFGVSIQGDGSRYNQVSGNYIGLNYTGSSSLGNAAGVCLGEGAKHNTIGGLTSEYGNVISGNRSDEFPYSCGVLITGPGTQFNYVSANKIGLDATGLKAKRNGSCGVIIGSGAQYNVVGGANLTDGNIISGNGVEDPLEGQAAGIHIFGSSTSYNRISGNLIGPDVTSLADVGNRGHGIGLYSGAHNNLIGGNSFREANTISGNEGAAVFISGSQTRSNLIFRNMMEGNDGLGIDIRDTAQGGIKPPRITTVGMLYIYGMRLVSGRDAPIGARIDVYEVYSPDPTGSGEGYAYRGTTVANALGRFEFYLPAGPAVPVILTAVTIDTDSNTSAFSVNAYSPDATSVDDPSGILPHEFSVNQNFPNPFNAGTEINFSLPQRSFVSLTVFNVLGQKVRSLADRYFSAGNHYVTWDGRDNHGGEVASGVYFYRLDCEVGSVSRKMLLLK